MDLISKKLFLFTVTKNLILKYKYISTVAIATKVDTNFLYDEFNNTWIGSFKTNS